MNKYKIIVTNTQEYEVEANSKDHALMIFNDEKPGVVKIIGMLKEKTQVKLLSNGARMPLIPFAKRSKD